jgi:hypothetical protein
MALCGIGALLPGCAPLPPEPAGASPAPAAGRGTPLLTPWMTLAGAWRASAPTAQPLPLPMPVPGGPPNQRLNFQLPVGVALLGDLS